MEPGTKVTWTHMGGWGRNIQLTTREGVVVEAGDRFTQVKRRGRIEKVRTADLRVAGGKTALTEFAEGVFAANRRQDA